MKMSWLYFAAAVFFASYLLLSSGVPIVPVVLGCLLAAVLTWRKLSSRKRLTNDR
jgi:hypothetical protein